MSFLDQLKDVGFGNRGPFGRMESGASHLADTLQTNVAVGRSRGVAQVIAELAKKGQITAEDQIAVSEKWGVPLQEVMQLVKPINTEAESKRLEKMGKTAYQIAQSRKQRNPGWKPTNKDATQIAHEAGAKSNEDVAYVVSSFRKIVEQKKLFDHNPENQLLSKGSFGEITTEKEAVTPPAKPKEDKLYPLSPDQKLVDKSGKEIARGIKKPATGAKTQAELASDIRSASQQLISLKAGVDIVKEVLAAPAHTEALREAKKQILVMIKEYEELYGVGSARKIGFDTTLSKPTKEIVRTGSVGGKKVIEYSDGSIEYAD